MKKRLLFFVVLAISLLDACQKTTEDFNLKEIDYAAEKIGRIRVYKVDSQIFNINTGFGKDTTITYFERHQTLERQKDSTGSFYFYHLVTRSPNNLDWLPYYAYKTYYDTLNFTKVVDNKKVIHLSLPVRDFKSWDGNLYNQEKGGQRFRYVDEDELLLPDSVFKEQITVRLKKEILPITESNAHFESYAPNIGMVYKYKYYNNIQRKDSSSVISQSGHHLHYNLIYHN